MLELVDIQEHLDQLTNAIGELQVVIEAKQPRQVWLTKKQATTRLGIGRTKLQGLIDSGKLQSNRLDGVVRIHISDIDSLVRFGKAYTQLPKRQREIIREMA